MFGYLITNRAELKVREDETYKKFYCGVCRSLGENSGYLSRFSLTYDMTFLAVLLSDLYDEPFVSVQERCPGNPFRVCEKALSSGVDYAADMNILLTYYNLLDNVRDDGKKSSLFAARCLRKPLNRIKEQYPRQYHAVRGYVRDLRKCELKNEPNPDLGAGLTGKMLAEVFAKEDDIWAERLRNLGFYLGKFIYLMDACEDAEEDSKSGTYNPFLPIFQDSDYEEKCRSMLTLMIAEAARNFETLPVVEYAPILRNILYSGVWTAFEKHFSETNADHSPKNQCMKEQPL
ncbi:MAG: hypothetical protein IJJ25_01045 [Lachnospiraceae bacterium]|nr:hypothetical protein [Lachnospiraceae bacterium]